MSETPRQQQDWENLLDAIALIRDECPNPNWRHRP